MDASVLVVPRPNDGAGTCPIAVDVTAGVGAATPVSETDGAGCEGADAGPDAGALAVVACAGDSDGVGATAGVGEIDIGAPGALGAGAFPMLPALDPEP